MSFFGPHKNAGAANYEHSNVSSNPSCPTVIEEDWDLSLQGEHKSECLGFSGIERRKAGWHRLVQQRMLANPSRLAYLALQCERPHRLRLRATRPEG